MEPIELFVLNRARRISRQARLFPDTGRVSRAWLSQAAKWASTNARQGLGRELSFLVAQTPPEAD